MALLSSLNQPKYKLIIILAIIAISLGIIFTLMSSAKKTEQQPFPSISPSHKPDNLYPGFSTTNIPSIKETTSTPSSSTTEQGDPSYPQFLRERFLQRYPLYLKTPYEDENFYIRYTGPLKFEVKMKTSTASAQPAALNWIQSNGIDPSTHEIIFK